MLPRLAIRLPPEGEAIEPRALFDFPVRAIWLEVGFGAGEQLLAQARAHPDIGFLGCEPFMTGVARLLAGIEDLSLPNIRVFCDDARLLLARLPSQSIERVFVLFPDPWPKKRHHKRRIVSSPVLHQLGRIMTAGGQLHVATDDAGYLAWILECVLRHGGFEWSARRPEDWRHRPSDWPETRYESKASEAGRRSSYLLFRRRDGVGSGA